MSEDVELWPWQRNIVDQAVSSTATLCGHPVGAGKTRSMVATCLALRQFGLANKPLIVVPNHLLDQIASEARQMFPAARLLVATKESLGGEMRRVFAARCATGDWDAVIMTHGSFGSLPVSPATEASWLEDQKSALYEGLRSSEGGYFGSKEIARRLRSLDARLAVLRDSQSDPATVLFEHLGVDFLAIDEAHYYKRMPISSRVEGFSFGASKRSTDLLLKSQWLRSRRGERPSLALFTGTPWTNTLAETFVWQTLVQPDLLASLGLGTFDAWASTFVQFDSRVEVAPDGSGFRLVTRPSKIRNAPELRALLGQNADVIHASTLPMQRPDVRRETVIVTPTPEQRLYTRGLAQRAEQCRTGRGNGGADNILRICGEGRLLALDPQLLPSVGGASPKVETIAQLVATRYHSEAETTFPGSSAKGVLQVIFCDLGTPGAKGDQTYGRIRDALVARGVPASKVRFVHEATTDHAKAALFSACRDGSVSVLIGSTDKCGVGTNIQRRLRAVVHADAPWRPSDMEQREGRAVRPHNLNGEVVIIRVVTQETFDGFMYQTIERKAWFIEQMYHGDARSIEDIGAVALDYSHVKALATGNPLLMDHAQVASEVQQLQVLRAIDAQSIRGVADHAAYALRARQARSEQLALAAPLVGLPLTVAGRLGGLAEQLSRGWRYGSCEVGPLQLRVAAESVTLQVDYRRVGQIEVPPKVLKRSVATIQAYLEAEVAAWLDGLPDELAKADTLLAEAVRADAEAQDAFDRYVFSRESELRDAQARLADIEARMVEEPEQAPVPAAS